MQRISREEESLKAHKNHEELMSIFKQDISQVCQKLKKIGIYRGNNVLEEFCSNTQALCNDESETSNHEFYKMCVKDNMMIFDIAVQEAIKIPHMTLQNLKDILFKKLKLNKACDVYKLTVEHLWFAGDETLSSVLFLLNAIIDNINCLSSTQLNKPTTHHKSWMSG